MTHEPESNKGCYHVTAVPAKHNHISLTKKLDRIVGGGEHGDYRRARIYHQHYIKTTMKQVSGQVQLFQRSQDGK